MKRKFAVFFSAVVLIVSMLMFSCSGKYYDEVKPTRAENTTVITTSYGDIKYDLFRAFYLTGVSAGKDSDTAAENALLFVSGIYAIFSECENVGIDTESNKVMNKVDDMIVASVDGGEIDGIKYQGYGSFDAYLSALKEQGLTDRVNRLIIRSYVCEQLLTEYYLSKENIPDENLVREYFASDDCIRITWLSTEIEENAKKALQELSSKETEKEIVSTLIKYTPNATSGYEDGWYIGKYEGGDNYKEVMKVAFELTVEKYSDIVRDNNGMYYIIYRMTKEDSYIDSNYDDVRTSYLYNLMRKNISERANDIAGSASFTQAYNDYMQNPSSINME